MRSLFYLFLFLTVSNTAIGQDFEFSAGDTLIKIFEVNDYTGAHTKIKNLSDSEVVFQWEIIAYEHPEGWEFTMCDFPYCYTEGETSGTMFPAEAFSEMAFLTVNIEATTVDTGFYQIAVWDQEIEGIKDTLTITMIATPAYSSLKSELKDPIPSFYYNQLFHQLTLNNPSDNTVNFDIYNYMGQILQTVKLQANSQKIIEHANWGHGYYIVKHNDNDGNMGVGIFTIP